MMHEVLILTVGCFCGFVMGIVVAIIKRDGGL